MKKNLIKLLAIAGMIASLGACGKTQETSKSDDPSTSATSELTTTESTDDSSTTEEETPEVVTANQFYELLVDLDTSEVSAALEGKLVTVCDVVPWANIGDTIFGCVIDESTKLIDLRCIEFDLAEGQQFRAWDVKNQKEISGVNVNGQFRTILDVTGRVHYEDGRVYMQDTTYTTTSTERQGISWTGEMDRAKWTTYIEGYMLHGCLTAVTFQLCEPVQWNDDGDTVFYGVFAGEDYDMSNPDNFSPIKVTIPKEYTDFRADDKEITEGLGAGDLVYIEGVAFYSDEGVGIKFANGGLCYFDESDKVIIKEFADAAEIAQEFYEEEIPDFGVDEFALSYLVNTDYVDYPLDGENGVFTDASFLGFDDETKEKIVFTDWTVNIKTGKLADALGAFVAKVLAFGYKLGLAEEEEDTHYDLYQLKDEEETVLSAIEVIYKADGSYFEFYYLAEGVSFVPIETPCYYDARFMASCFVDGAGNSAPIDTSYYYGYGCYVISVGLAYASETVTAQSFAEGAEDFLLEAFGEGNFSNVGEAELQQDGSYFVAFTAKLGSYVEANFYEYNGIVFVDFAIYEEEFVMWATVAANLLLGDPSAVTYVASKQLAYLFTYAPTSALSVDAAKALVASLLGDGMEFTLVADWAVDPEDGSNYIVFLLGDIRAIGYVLEDSGYTLIEIDFSYDTEEPEEPTPEPDEAFKF